MWDVLLWSSDALGWVSQWWGRHDGQPWVPDGQLAGVSSLPSSQMQPQVEQTHVPALYFSHSPPNLFSLTLPHLSPAKPLTGIPTTGGLEYLTLWSPAG